MFLPPLRSSPDGTLKKEHLPPKSRSVRNKLPSYYITDKSRLQALFLQILHFRGQRDFALKFGTFSGKTARASAHGAYRETAAAAPQTDRGTPHRIHIAVYNVHSARLICTHRFSALRSPLAAQAAAPFSSHGLPKSPPKNLRLRRGRGGVQLTSTASSPITSMSPHGITQSSSLPSRPKHL